MKKNINIFFEEIKDERVCFIGMGVSHFELIKMFKNRNIDVTVCDKRTADQIGEKYTELRNLGVNFILGEYYLEELYTFDIIFRTPGMNFYNEDIQHALRNGCVITSEMEMFFEYCPCKIYAVTGSDGKTTTTTLISEMLAEEGKVVHKGGNIGRALLPIIESIDKDDVAVVELSSFQLISMRQSPDVAVITNITPNHLDVHKDMEEYIFAKKNIFLHQGAFSRTVLNMDNDITRDLREQVRGKVEFFSIKNPVETGAFLDKDGYLCKAKKGVVTRLFHMNDIKLPGMHNVENYLTAICAVRDEVSVENMKKVAENFAGVEHRIEFVRELDGVKYYNDSIATSPTRTIAGLKAFNQKLIVIAGGYDKNIPYEPLAPYIAQKVKILILLGATAKKIKASVLECKECDVSDLKIIEVATLEDAVSTARELAQNGDIVTLSPASASFDLYVNFEQRGQHFKDVVNALK